MAVRRVVAMLVVVVLAGAVAAFSAGASSGGARDEGCTWGASSVAAVFEDGRVVESAPATSGCIPGS